MKVQKENLFSRKTKKGKSFILDYRLNGKRIRKVAAYDRHTAEKIKADIQKKLSLEMYDLTVINSEIISLEDLINQYLNQKKDYTRESTYKRYLNYFNGFKDFMINYFPTPSTNIRSITSEHLNQCFIQLTQKPINNRKPWHKGSVNILRDLVSEMFNYAKEKNYIQVNPVKQIKYFKVPKSTKIEFFDDNTLKIIFDNLDQYWIPFFKFLLFTGLRKGEAINLTWSQDNLDEDNPSINLTSNKDFQTKSGKSNFIKITKNAYDILLSQRNINSKYVFVSKRGNKIRKSTPNEELASALKNTNINGIIHMFRHTFAAKFLMSGGTLYDLSKFLSHSDIETTKIYAHLSPEYMKGNIVKMEDWQSKIK
jgi:integrase/recombinase XerD